MSKPITLRDRRKATRFAKQRALMKAADLPSRRWSIRDRLHASIERCMAAVEALDGQEMFS